MSGHHLVLGGRKSGKTAFAEAEALEMSDNPAYLATGQAFDAEMAARIAAHRASRDPRFTTHEEPLKLVQAIASASQRHGAILIDCLTLWLTNLMMEQANIGIEINGLVDAVRLCKTPLVLVSNEVGLGGVSENEEMRRFSDHAGQLHQDLAQVCDQVTMVIAGLPLTVKAPAPR